MIKQVDQYALFLMRIGLGFVFFWEGFASVFIGELPRGAQSILDGLGVRLEVELASFFLGIVLLVVGLMLLIGLFTKHAAGIASLYLVAMVVLTILYIPGGFALYGYRSIALLGTALALTSLGCSVMGIDSSFED